MRPYCQVAPGHPFHGPYHDHEYGFPLRDDNLLFERLILEINQAGLSWLTILKKRTGFRRAYHNFDLEAVAAYGEEDRLRLLNEREIIRNRLKIDAAIENARRIIEIQKEYGSFAAWLDHHHPLRREEWVKLFKKTFRFTGGEIVGEFLLSTGYLPGAHAEDCPVYAEIVALNPPWMGDSESQPVSTPNPLSLGENQVSLPTMIWSQIQRRRFQGTRLQINVDMGPGEIRQFCPVDQTSTNLLKAAMRQMQLLFSYSPIETCRFIGTYDEGSRGDFPAPQAAPCSSLYRSLLMKVKNLNR